MEHEHLCTIQIVEKFQALISEVKDFESALKSLRGNGPDWNVGIEKDERPAVKTLYLAYKEAKERANDFNQIIWKEA
jgi:hypothetical protein